MEQHRSKTINAIDFQSNLHLHSRRRNAINSRLVCTSNCRRGATRRLDMTQQLGRRIGRTSGEHSWRRFQIRYCNSIVKERKTKGRTGADSELSSSAPTSSTTKATKGKGKAALAETTEQLQKKRRPQDSAASLSMAANTWGLYHGGVFDGSQTASHYDMNHAVVKPLPSASARNFLRYRHQHRHRHSQLQL